MNNTKLRQALQMQWAAFNAALRSVSEQEAERLLQLERRGRRRHLYLMRLYGKWSTLRERRERHELLQTAVEGSEQ